MNRGRKIASRNSRFRSLPVNEWPLADQQAWAEACRPGVRLKPGGAASRLASVSRADLATRYGAYLGFLQRTGHLRSDASAAAQVTASNVNGYLAELKSRVRSVTQWNCIYKLRLTAELLAPESEFEWLREIERDLALMMQPRSKLDRLVFSGPLVEAGLTLMIEAQQSKLAKMDRARQIRNGLMIAILAIHPNRIKNFASLELEKSFRKIAETWWIVLTRSTTKSRRAIEQQVPNQLNRYIDMYLTEARPVLAGADPLASTALWISSRTGQAITTKNLGTLISKITFRTLGVDVSPHLFRTSAASSAPAYAPNFPHLNSALLGHSDPRVTDQAYTVVKSINAAGVLCSIAMELIGAEE